MQNQKPVRLQPYAYLLTEQDEKDIACIQETDIPRTVATLLILLHRHGNKTDYITSRWMETAAYLRQPEVSMAIRYLNGSGILTQTTIDGSGHGRPEKQYFVMKSIPEYIRKKTEARIAEMNLAVTRVNRIFQSTGATA